MQPSKPLGKYINGLKIALKSYGAKQRDQYSWIAKTDKYFVFTVEIDHINKQHNKYNHTDGIFYKRVRPISIESGDTPLKVSHGKELFDALQETLSDDNYCHLLLVKGAKFGTTPGGVKVVLDNDLWKVSQLEGHLDKGFEFTMQRATKN